jgi:RNA polymerase primary sigma factor
MLTRNLDRAPVDADLPPLDAGPAPAARDLADAARGGPLSVYFRDIARTPVMTHAEELALALRIAELRRSLWHATLGYPPFVHGICELAREVLGDERSPVAALDVMVQAARALRDRDLLVHRNNYVDARERLSVAMAEADPDGRVIDRVLADLISVEGGCPGPLNMKVKLPPRGSLPFISHVTAVKAQHAVLSIARSEFARANLRLVVTIARRYNRGRMALQDLVQEGNLGLLKAVNRFDASKGCRFSTYGSWWIRHAVTRALADKGRTVRLPVHMIDAYNKVLRARRHFEVVHGRAASEPELIAATGVSGDRLARMQISVMENPISLDEKVSLGGAGTLLESIEDQAQASAPDAIDHAVHLEHLKDVFDVLTPFEAEIMRRRMGLDDHPEMTLKQIGGHYGLSRERIRQLQQQALEKLRAAFRERGLL